MDYVEKFYEDVHGCYPFSTDNNKIKSQKIIDYLIDAQVSEETIINFVENAPKVDYLNPDILPEELWNNSLLKKNTFYYHSILHIISPPPTWDPINNKSITDNFFLEMQIMFTKKDRMFYFYHQIQIDEVFIDEKKDLAALDYLLKKYKKFSQFEPIDFILSCIDYAHSKNDNIQNILDLTKYEIDVFNNFYNQVKNAEVQNANQIVWR